MPTRTVISDKDGITVIGVTNSPNDYLIWRFDPDEREKIYFEYDDRIHGGYNIAKEITISLDGIHILLMSDRLVHFYFNELLRSDYEQFIQILRQVYVNHQSILEVLD